MNKCKIKIGKAPSHPYSFLCITLNPAIQKTVLLSSLQLDSVNRSSTFLLNPSSKALNSARVLSQILPNSTLTLSILGGKRSKHFLSLCAKECLPCSYVLYPGTVRECITLLGRKDKNTTELILNEKGHPINLPQVEEAFLSLLEETLTKYKAFLKGVIVSGSAISGILPEFYSKVFSIISKHSLFTLADFTGEALKSVIKIYPPAVIKINEEEYKKTFCPKDLILSMKELSKELENIVIVTRGSLPIFVSVQGVFSKYPIKTLNPVNATGAGDTFNASFLYKYTLTKDLLQSICYAVNLTNLNLTTYPPASIL